MSTDHPGGRVTSTTADDGILCVGVVSRSWNWLKIEDAAMDVAEDEVSFEKAEVVFLGLRWKLKKEQPFLALSLHESYDLLLKVVENCFFDNLLASGPWYRQLEVL